MTLTTKLTSKGTWVGRVNDNGDISYVCHSGNIFWIISADEGARISSMCHFPTEEDVKNAYISCMKQQEEEAQRQKVLDSHSKTYVYRNGTLQEEEPLPF